jgi:hypothetical protein
MVRPDAALWMGPALHPRRRTRLFADVNFARDVVEAAPPGRRALVALDGDGSRREFAMGEIAAAARDLAAELHAAAWAGATSC